MSLLVYFQELTLLPSWKVEFYEIQTEFQFNEFTAKKENCKLCSAKGTEIDKKK